jgi:hypothetical protein
VLIVAALAGLFGGLYWLLKGAQKRDPSQRGRDSSGPGGFYTDTGA